MSDDHACSVYFTSSRGWAWSCRLCGRYEARIDTKTDADRMARWHTERAADVREVFPDADLTAIPPF